MATGIIKKKVTNKTSEDAAIITYLLSRILKLIKYT